MKVHEAEAILKYYADIPQRIEIIRSQCTALSDEVDPMRGMGTDGMPRGGTPGDSTAAMACRMDEDVYKRQPSHWARTAGMMQSCGW